MKIETPMKCNFTITLPKFRNLENARCWLEYETINPKGSQKINKTITTIITNTTEIRSIFKKKKTTVLSTYSEPVPALAVTLICIIFFIHDSNSYYGPHFITRIRKLKHIAIKGTITQLQTIE